jgi:hypothetical protein
MRSIREKLCAEMLYSENEIHIQNIFFFLYRSHFLCVFRFTSAVGLTEVLLYGRANNSLVCKSLHGTNVKALHVHFQHENSNVMDSTMYFPIKYL